MVVADEDQSIYSWRGSDPKYIEQFKKDFKPSVVELEEHYRCSERILRAAGAVIAKNTRQKESVLKTHKGAGNTLYHYMTETPDREANLAHYAYPETCGRQTLLLWRYRGILPYTPIGRNVS